MKISEIMNRPVIVEDNISLRQAAKLMSEKRVGSLIVTNTKKIVGIITENDVIKNISSLNGKISKSMTKNVITIDSGESIENAAVIMGKNKIKRLPVIKNENLVGIITATDILANSEDLGESFFFD